MKKLIKYSFAFLVMSLAGMITSCSEYTPKGYEEVPDLPTVNNLKADVSNRVVTLSWQLPSTSLQIDALSLIVNNNAGTAISLDPSTTSYTVKGQPMEDTYMYTLKIRYKDGHVSTGQTVTATVPYEDLANVSNLMVTKIEGKNVTLSWDLPNSAGITGVLVGIDGDESSAILYEGQPSGCVVRSQATNQTVHYRVRVVYDSYYTSNGVTCPADIPFMESKMAFLLLADAPADLPDDDERAAAAWFMDQDKADFVKISDLEGLDPDEYAVLWILVDRVGLPLGWENLPDGLANAETIEAIKAYTKAGGSLFLANMATQLTEPLGIVPQGMAPNIFGNGDGGSGDDVWVINPYLGWDFQNNPDIDFYDRTAHAIYAGIDLVDPNNYGYGNIPLIGPGQREDHNCMWDCNVWGNGAYNNSVKNFEVTTNSLVLATWGHVRDHCVAGLVEFYANSEHGRCVACGFAAYEWNQNSGPNPYQGNVEKLTANILNYLM